MDIKLPDMEGTDLLLMVNRISPHTIKIMMTGFASAENQHKSLNRGADAYLVKPIGPQQLLSTIKEKLYAQ
jgi:YesN/AraC family two-component response regulator